MHAYLKSYAYCLHILCFSMWFQLGHIHKNGHPYHLCISDAIILGATHTIWILFPSQYSAWRNPSLNYAWLFMPKEKEERLLTKHIHSFLLLIRWMISWRIIFFGKGRQQYLKRHHVYIYLRKTYKKTVHKMILD